MRKKISIIGAGFVGATTAQLLADKMLGDIVLLDINEGIVKGKALDISQMLAVKGIDANVKGTSFYEDTADSSIVVITAGLPRKPGMSRDELLAANAGIVKPVSENIKKYSPKAIVIVVTNPLDAMAYLVWKTTGFPQQRIIGMAGVLDSGRMKAFIASELNVSVKDVQAFVMGGHGDTMIPLMRYASVSGVPLTDLMPKEKIDEIVSRTRNGGAEIVSLLQTGSAYYAPAASVVEMVESILLDRKRVFPCCVYLSGEYGVKDLFVGVPVVLGCGGAEKVIEVELDEDEKKLFDATVESVKDLVNLLFPR